MKLFSCLMILLLCRLMFCYENLSRRRTTRLTQSSTHIGRKAWEGNDGVTDTRYPNCAHTTFNKTKAWFQVDLGKTFSIQKIKIYFRKEDEWPQYRSRQFYLDVSDLPATQTLTTQRTRCYTDNTTAPNFPSNIQTINCNQKARYVIVETTYDPHDDGDSGAVLEICEIEVYGCDVNCIKNTCNDITGFCTLDCKTGTYGDFCNKACSSCPEGCNRDTGVCEGACPVGKFGTYCDQTCDLNCKGQCDKTTGVCISCASGRFGRYCGNVCSGCSTGCDKITGECEGSCPVGKFGTRCKQTCDQNCQGQCNKTTGVCISCVSGRFGCYCGNVCSGCLTRCDKDTGECEGSCTEGKFGTRCEETCSQTCQNGCEKISGVCTSCIQGRYGNSCNELCGGGCVFGCDRLYGHCACKPGWEANNCKRCDATHYGADCSFECSVNCINQNCNNMTGSCTHGCKTGYYGDFCNSICCGCLEGCHRDTGACVGACPVGKFGTHCEKTCSKTCEGGCLKTSGVCTSCIDGWYGDTCEEICGAGCSLRCDQVDGNCTCKPGWGGYGCRECSPYFYGESCEKPCSKNCDQGVCFANNGSCIKGLSLQNPKKESTQYLVYVFAGLLIISVCLNTYLIMRRAKRCKQETQKSKNIANNPDERIELVDLNPVFVETEEQDAVYEALAETNDVCEMSHYEELPSTSHSKNMENNPIYANS